MVFTSSAEYAIRAITHLALLPTGTLAGAREISRAESIPMPFLWKILQKLCRRKLVRSFKGLRGGYELARPAELINLQDLVEATNGDELDGRCVLGLAHCDEARPCPLHDQWKEIRSQMVAMLEKTTIADLARIAASRRPKRS
jgi:Rrf2 family transcriptional regulator, iron-sulfur cluster assembly transcription factor